MKRLLIAMLALMAGTVVGCVDDPINERNDENADLLLDDSGSAQNIVFGELRTETGQCSPGDIIRCYSGPSDKVNVGICKAGYYECIQEESGKWVWDSAGCKDEVLPDYTYPCSEDEPDADYDCNGIPDNMQDEDGDGLTICSNDGFKEDMCDLPGGCGKTTAVKSLRTNKLKVLTVNNYSYTGSTQTVLLQPGTYKFEVWGAQGGGRNLGINGCNNDDQGMSGKGGYATGIITFSTATTVYVNVGGAGSCSDSGVAAGGFNCGTVSSDCTGHASSSYEPGGGGGGATDIRIGSTSLYSRVIVAGGGGGGGEDTYDSYGHGGGQNGVGYNSTFDASQTSAGLNGSFGRGASTNRGDGGGGGGGWYGGGTSSSTTVGSDTQGGGGGSGYVYSAATASSYPSGCTLNASHQMSSTMLIDGASSMPSPNGSSETGHSGNGYARISKLSVTNSVDFDYSGHTESYTLLPGSYKLEVWGAQGGYRSSSQYGGKGGYSVGTIKLTETTTVYVNVGGQGNLGTCRGSICSGGYNGGGYRYMYKGGGGATDIRIKNNSLYSRVIVAGGGGSDGDSDRAGGAGGGFDGLESNPDYYVYGEYGGTGGSQTGTADLSNPRNTENTTSLALGDSYISGNNYYFGGFGFGGAGLYSRGGFGGAGGGGWYGGNGVDPDCCLDDERGGGGGSGYVYTSWSAGDYPSGCQLSSKYYLKNADIFEGNSVFLDPDGDEETGHSGNGYARITQVPDVVEDTEVYHIDYQYTGSVQPVTLEPGKYKFEVWGAQGGYRSSSNYGGLGGYSVGIIELASKTDAYVYVGGQGNSGTCNSSTQICTGGFNGGGYRYKYKGGGGGTDIRLNTDSLYSRVIVAGGGGSDGSTTRKGGYAGGLSGERRSEAWAASTYCGYGGTQVYSGYSSSTYRSTPNTSQLTGTSASYFYGGFGFGGAGTYYANGYGGAGGGGWYGGTGVAPDCCVDDERGGGGGSGYVYTDKTYMNYPTGSLLSTDYFLTEASTHAGNSSFTSPSGGHERGHRGNGFARITLLETAGDVEQIFDFDYTGDVQPISIGPGKYKLEVWGAQGGNTENHHAGGFPGGKGGYSTGILNLDTTIDAYVYVGGEGSSVCKAGENFGGFNGGGPSPHSNNTSYHTSGSGGGASDIRLINDSLWSRVIVAGGGGGAGVWNWSSYSNDAIGGSGGGANGENGHDNRNQQELGAFGAKGGTPFTGAGFGRGGSGGGAGSGCTGGAGGGGGWYGGIGSGRGQCVHTNSAGGGSGWVFTEDNVELGLTYSTYTGGTWLLSEDYYLTGASTFMGTEQFTDPNGSLVTGHEGNGYARITKLVPPGKCAGSNLGAGGVISDTTCGHASDIVTLPPTTCAEICYNQFNPSVCGSGGCTTCNSFTEVFVMYVSGYGDIYSYICDGGYYSSTQFRYVCENFCASSSVNNSNVPVSYGGKQLAKAMDICSIYDPHDAQSYGLMEASVSRDVTTNQLNAKQIGILPGMKRTDGTVQIAPRGGETLALMSSGWATDAYHSSHPSGSYGYCSTTLPAIYSTQHGSSLGSNPGCPNPTARHCDGVQLHLKLKAPPGAQGFSFDFRFFSYEYPGWVCTSFNDFFLALVTDQNGNAIVDTDGDGRLDDEDGNVAFDETGNPVTINSGFFTTCTNNSTKCTDGGDDLYGFTNSSSNGATNWLTTTVPITAGQVFNLDFYIWDTSDSAYDSTVLLDNFKWRTQQTSIGTGFSEDFDQDIN